MAIEWNDRQKNAIDGRGGTMLVSAAAGSGKTAVLVERVMRLITDESNPCTIDRLLIVTFTRAAASQMKEKISNAISLKLSQDPGNALLRKNKFLLPYANIGTIDSFCINTVRNNFQELGISSDFGIIDQASEEVLKKEAIEEVIEKYHTERGEEFSILNSLVNDNRDDVKTAALIRRLYDNSTAYEFPEEWLEEICSEYDTDKPVEETKAGKFLIKKAEEYTDGILNRIHAGLKETEKYTGKEKEKNYEVLLEDLEVFTAIRNAIKGGNWDEIAQTVFSTSVRNRITPNVKYFNELRSYSRKSDNHYQDNFTAFKIPSEQSAEIMKTFSGPMKTLRDAVMDYSSVLMEKKNELNEYSFSDILHFTLKLLIEKKNGETVRTPFAERFSENFREILVDEYQDVSKAQDTIFWAISKNNTNRFMVGDVKQSIYSFRQAMPEVFTDLRKDMYDYNGKDYPAREFLNCNYRSRSGITGAVNYIFSKIMFEETGGVDYGYSEQLNPEAKYPENDSIATSVALVNSSRNKYESEAEYIAGYILNAIVNKMQITGKDGKLRDAVFSDFCILYRSNNCVKAHTEVLKKYSIPFTVKNENSFLQTAEIEFVTSLLKVIDNPSNDIALTAVLLSPVYGFSPDELSRFRIDCRKGNIYQCLSAAAKNGNRKASDFIDNLKKLKRIAVTYPAGEFSERIIDETGYRAIVSSMPAGEARLSNLNSFINLANRYEQTGIKGISGFVRFIDKLNAESIKATSSAKTDLSEAVKLMTIHGSKGLEFPVVILTQCDSLYNTSDIRDNVIISKECGLGMYYIKDNTKYDTVFRYAASMSVKIDRRAEEMRILYVALTRAKEKLLIVCGSTNWDSTFNKINKIIPGGKDPEPSDISKISNYRNLILTALLKHPDAHLLRNLAKDETGIHDHCDTRIDFTEDDLPYDGKNRKTVIQEEKYNPDPVMKKEIEERLSYRYPYEALNGISAKQVASHLDTDEFSEIYFACSKPAFTQESGLTAAQKGTAAHAFMQYADYSAAKAEPEKELRRLVSEGILSEAEAESIDIAKISAFFSSGIAAQINSADRTYREYEFTSAIPLRDFYPEISEETAGNDVIIVEGMVDCAFEKDGKLTILDFKTDKVKDPADLIKEYSGQLNIYKKCLSRVLGKDTADSYIYSFHLGKLIKV